MGQISEYAIGMIINDGNKRINQVVVFPNDTLPVRVKKQYSFTCNKPESLTLEITRSKECTEELQNVEIIGNYQIEITKALAEDTLIELIFEVSDKRELKVKVQIPDIHLLKIYEVKLLQPVSVKKPFFQKKKRQVPLTIQEYFENVVGMQSVKEKLGKRYALLCMKEKWEQMGMELDASNWNFMIAGEPGSGKSLLTDILCDMMYQFGIVTSLDPVIFNAKSILNDCSILENEKITSSVIIIENTECICPSGKPEEAWEGADTWMYFSALLEAESDKTEGRNYYIFTGEREAIGRLCYKDPRVENQTCVLEITSYDLEELFAIARDMIAEKGFLLSPEASKKLKSEIKYEAASDEFANMITLEGIIEKAIENKSARELSNGKVGRTLEVEDFAFDEPTEESIEELMAQLEDLVGLSEVKRQVRLNVNRVQERQEKDSFFLHTMLLGAPGTGKTTVARLLGKIYGSLGILRKGDLFVEATRSDLVGRYQGETAIKTKELIRSAVGGVLFIDEAYSLWAGDGDTFGKEAVTELLKYAWDYRDRMMIILAGYEKEMDLLMNANSGMARRFPHKIYFADYTQEELYEIFKRKIQGCYTIEPDAEPLMQQLIGRYSKLKGYENGGGIDIHIEELSGVIAERNMLESKNGDAIEKERKAIILKTDVEAVLKNGKHGIRSLEELLEELDGMVGLSAVKSAVRDVVNSQRYQKMLMEKLGKSVEISSEHMIFAGPPGTGKSTLAQLVTQIYCALGIVQDPTRCITVTKSDLNSDVMGGALEKAKQIIEKARGGVLFIDEAYSLVEDEKDLYGKQVLTELMYSIEKYRGEIVLIMAGYKEQIDELIRKYNPGMASRISTVIPFENYTIEELVQIFYRMTQKGEITYEIEEGLEPLIQELIEKRMQKFEQEGKEFGNARGVRNLMNETIRQVVNRCMESKQEENLTKICKEDILFLIAQN